MVLLLTKILGTISVFLKVLPEFLAIASTIRGKENINLLKDKLDNDKQRIKDAFKETDPNIRSSKLNDIFNK